MTNLITQVSPFQNDEQSLPNHILDLLGESEALKLAGEHEQAIEILQKILCEEPECLMAYEQIADNHLILNHVEKARKAARFALELDPASCLAHYVLGFIHIQKSHWKAAHTHLTKADEFLPNNPEILRCLGWSFFKLGKCTKGVILIERVLTMVPEDPVALCDLGVCYFELKYFEKALDLFVRAVEVDKNSERAQKMLKVAEEVVQTLSKMKREQD